MHDAFRKGQKNSGKTYLWYVMSSLMVSSINAWKSAILSEPHSLYSISTYAVILIISGIHLGNLLQYTRLNPNESAINRRDRFDVLL